jgi:NADH dehydrogenase
MPERTILITGADGKIGNFLVNCLLAIPDYKLVLFCRKNIATQDVKNVRYVYADITNPVSYSFALQGVDTIVHLAGVTHTNRRSYYYKVNVDATRSLIRIAEQSGVKRFIFASTRAISENGGDYSRSKLMAEKILQESALQWIIMRLSEVYGIEAKKGIEGLFNRPSCLGVIPIIGKGDYRMNPVHISDVVCAFVRLIERPRLRNRIYTIAGPQSFTFNELIDKALLIHEKKGIKVHVPLILIRCVLFILSLFGDRFLVRDQLPRLLSHKSDDVSLAMSELDFRPKSIRENFLELQNHVEMNS